MSDINETPPESNEEILRLTEENRNLKQQLKQLQQIAEEQMKQIQVTSIIEQVTPALSSLGQSLSDLFNPKWWKYAFDLATILGVVIPITYLGANGDITDCTLGTLFGSIIGYALARFRKGIE